MTATAIVTALNAVQALISWIVNMGVTRDRIQAMLDESNASGIDISTSTVQAELDASGDELDDTQGMIDNER